MTVSGHIHEDRKRAYVFQLAEGVAELFMEELRAWVDAYGPKSVAEALEEVGVTLPPGVGDPVGRTAAKERRLANRAGIRSCARYDDLHRWAIQQALHPTTDPPTVVGSRQF